MNYGSSYKKQLQNPIFINESVTSQITPCLTHNAETIGMRPETHTLMGKKLNDP